MKLIIIILAVVISLIFTFGALIALGTMQEKVKKLEKLENLVWFGSFTVMAICVKLLVWPALNL